MILVGTFFHVYIINIEHWLLFTWLTRTLNWIWFMTESSPWEYNITVCIIYIFSSLDFKMIIFPSGWRGNFVVSLTYWAVCFSIYFCVFEFWPRDRYSVIIFFISYFYRFEHWVKTVIDHKIYKCCIYYNVHSAYTTWIKETVCHFQRTLQSKKTLDVYAS